MIREAIDALCDGKVSERGQFVDLVRLMQPWTETDVALTARMAVSDNEIVITSGEVDFVIVLTADGTYQIQRLF